MFFCFQRQDLPNFQNSALQFPHAYRYLSKDVDYNNLHLSSDSKVNYKSLEMVNKGISDICTSSVCWHKRYKLQILPIQLNTIGTTNWPNYHSELFHKSLYNILLIRLFKWKGHTWQTLYWPCIMLSCKLWMFFS